MKNYYERKEEAIKLIQKLLEIIKPGDNIQIPKIQLLVLHKTGMSEKFTNKYLLLLSETDNIIIEENTIRKKRVFGKEETKEKEKEI